jgi:hypothetical protein
MNDAAKRARKRAHPDVKRLRWHALASPYNPVERPASWAMRWDGQGVASRVCGVWNAERARRRPARGWGGVKVESIGSRKRVLCPIFPVAKRNRGGIGLAQQGPNRSIRMN